MGCIGSKTGVKYSTRAPGTQQSTVGETGSVSPSKRRQRKWADGLDRHFHFKVDIEKEWDIFHREVLGKGAFGTVKKCKRVGDGPDGEVCAVKIISKEKLENKDDIEDLRVEVDCMNRLGSGSLNCIALYDTFEDDDNVYMVMEMATGGELYDRIKEGRYTEARAAQIAKSILQMLAQCHARNIVYRDIKPNNFMFVNKSEDSVLKGTDFGLAVYYPPGAPKLRDTTGTPYYMAPEVIKQSYGFEADVWSAGALIYQLLCGRVPFPPNPHLRGRDLVVDLFQRILKDPIDMTSKPTWPAISDNAKDLVRRLLTRNIAKRISITAALAHPWLKQGAAPEKPLEGDVVQRLQRYSTFGRLRQQVMVTALRMMKDDNGKLMLLPGSSRINDLEKMFQGMDKDESGSLSVEEITAGLKEANYAITDNEVMQLFRSIDVDKTGKIDCMEFLAAMVDWERKDSGDGKPPDIPEDDHLDLIWKDVFDKYDANGDGLVCVDEIAQVLRVPKDSPLIQDVLREVDTDGSGHISLEEFKRMMSMDTKDDLNIYSQRRRATPIA